MSRSNTLCEVSNFSTVLYNAIQWNFNRFLIYLESFMEMLYEIHDLLKEQRKVDFVHVENEDRFFI